MPSSLYNLLQRLNYRYEGSAENDPPASGEGSRRKVIFTLAEISGLVTAWLVVDGFHLLKSLAGSHGPWQFIRELQECEQGALALIAMSGIPMSIRPADIKGLSHLSF